MQVSAPPSPDRDAPLSSDTPLFRPEAVAERQTQWLGTVLLAPRLSHAAAAAFALLAAAGVLSLLFLGTYTRKVRVSGWLVPDAGLVRVLAPRAGVLVGLHVREGAEVRKGDVLAVLSTEVRSEAAGATRSEVARGLRGRRDSLVAGRADQEALHVQRAESLAKRLAALRDAETHLEREAGLQRDRLAWAEQGAQRQRQLYAGRLVPVDRVQQAEEDRLRQALTLQALERERVNLARERVGLDAELQELPPRGRMQLAETDRAVAALEQEIAETEAGREIVIVAPQDGTVTAVQAEPGGAAGTAVPLLTIVPAGAKLQAQLFGPSRAVGFVRPGDRVLLRYAAFPYQKFGQYEGRVASISRSAVSPSELPQRLSGLTALYGTDEPLYQIVVDPAHQAAAAYGEAVPLRPGMQLEADVLAETRRLVEWVLDPLFTLTGNWHR